MTKLRALALACVLAAGCGGSLQQHAHTATAEACDTAEGFIVQRDDSSKEADLRDLRRVRFACDELYRILEDE